MKCSLPFFFLVILFLVAVDADIVTETCQKAAQSDKNINYNFCVAALGADPKSHSADLEGLGFISLNIVKENATEINARIDELLKDGKSSIPLQDCKELYSTGLSTIREVVNALKSKDYPTANIKMSSVLDASSTCEDGFKEKPGLKSPLSVENAAFSQLSAIVLVLINFLNGASLTFLF